MTLPRRIASAAALLWITVGSTLTLLAIGTIASHVFFTWRHSRALGPFGYYDHMSQEDRDAYKGMAPADVDDLLDWTWKPGWVYEPWTGFREAPRASRFINVSEHGVRATAGGATDLVRLPADKAIYLFGGSTTFGYGVPDAGTIASHLQALLPGTLVVNLGRGYYYSAQENVLLMTLLQRGTEVRRAVFVDGLNERCELGVYQEEFARLFDMAQRGDSYEWRWRDQVFYPLQWLITRAGARLAALHAGVDLDNVPPRRPKNDLICSADRGPVPLRVIVRSNLKVRNALCTHFGISCLTVLQPIAGVHGRHLNLSTLPSDQRQQLRAKFDETKPAFIEAGAVDTTDALNGIPGHAFVDNVHYSTKGNAEIAARIAVSLLGQPGMRPN